MNAVILVRASDLRDGDEVVAFGSLACVTTLASTQCAHGLRVEVIARGAQFIHVNSEAPCIHVLSIDAEAYVAVIRNPQSSQSVPLGESNVRYN